MTPLFDVTVSSPPETPAALEAGAVTHHWRGLVAANSAEEAEAAAISGLRKIDLVRREEQEKGGTLECQARNTVVKTASSSKSDVEPETRGGAVIVAYRCISHSTPGGWEAIQPPLSEFFGRIASEW